MLLRTEHLDIRVGAGAAGPTLTIVALAIRLGAHLRSTIARQTTPA